MKDDDQRPPGIPASAMSCARVKHTLLVHDEMPDDSVFWPDYNEPELEQPRHAH